MSRTMTPRGKDVLQRVTRAISKLGMNGQFTSKDMRLRKVDVVERNNALQKLERMGVVARDGEVKRVKGRGRKAVVWKVVANVNKVA